MEETFTLNVLAHHTWLVLITTSSTTFIFYDVNNNNNLGLLIITQPQRVKDNTTATYLIPAWETFIFH